ncbi:hydroxysteroid (17-beta) dehydrogenase 14 L homeolog [Xenopus laevis]|uniref:Hydroxysteroid (17-beta) dehydrogenase 14 L homeolog n=1 Tax=Xenopus laevis TaxID=8355 RepID=A5D8P1_XENLA|nr:hydroxysteroid (17-beta) dehydrogenase 14 L homeolog [Xenopus laevis]AAI41756.1 Unknown (protein for MGC:160927) [Xenopus laevis]
MAASGCSEKNLRYRDKVTVITGGTKGIGEAMVKEFVENGARVVFCSKDTEAKALENEINKAGPGECRYVCCDVTKEEDIKKLIEITVMTYGRIDCLINNAGWHPPEQTIDDTTAEDFRDLLNLNLIGYFLTAKHALPHLRKTQGNVINISSLVGIIGQKHAIPYVATKGAVTAMTKAMAVDESQHNVRVNSISPGNIWTPLWEELSSHSENSEAMIQGGNDAQLLGRMGTAEECAKAALYLAAEGTFCTGIDLLLTGGAELNYANKSQQRARSSIYH